MNRFLSEWVHEGHILSKKMGKKIGEFSVFGKWKNFWRSASRLDFFSESRVLKSTIQHKMIEFNEFEMIVSYIELIR